MNCWNSAENGTVPFFLLLFLRFFSMADKMKERRNSEEKKW